MGQIKTLQDLFVEQVKDLYSSEQQIADAYEEWMQKLEHDSLKKVFEKRHREANRRMSELEGVAQQLSISPEGHLCKGTKGLIAEGKEFLDEAAEPDVMDAGIVANAQRVEHYSIAGYGCAKTYADQLGLGEAHDTLARIAKEAGEIDQQMSDLARRRLNKEATA